MNRVKTYSGTVAHLTKDDKITLCGRKIYPSWVKANDEFSVCTKCKKELEVNGNENKNNVKPVVSTKRKKTWRMATWEN